MLFLHYNFCKKVDYLHILLPLTQWQWVAGIFIPSNSKWPLLRHVQSYLLIVLTLKIWHTQSCISWQAVCNIKVIKVLKEQKWWGTLVHYEVQIVLFSQHCGWPVYSLCVWCLNEILNSVIITVSGRNTLIRIYFLKHMALELSRIKWLIINNLHIHLFLDVTMEGAITASDFMFDAPHSVLYLLPC